MEIYNFLTINNIFVNIKANNKKQIFHFISDKASKISKINSNIIFNCLLKREYLGSTGVGKGIAIPHAKFKSLTKIIGIFIKLNNSIEFKSIDNKPVNIIFLLMIPKNSGTDHLITLAKVSRFMRNNENIKNIYGTDNIDSLYAILTKKY